MPQILDTLRDKDVKAIFFVTQHYIETQPDLVKRMKDEGHLVGNHTKNHPSLPTLSIDEQRAELEKKRSGLGDKIANIQNEAANINSSISNMQNELSEIDQVLESAETAMEEQKAKLSRPVIRSVGAVKHVVFRIQFLQKIAFDQIQTPVQRE